MPKEIIQRATVNLWVFRGASCRDSDSAAAGVGCSAGSFAQGNLDNPTLGLKAGSLAADIQPFPRGHPLCTGEEILSGRGHFQLAIPY